MRLNFIRHKFIITNYSIFTKIRSFKKIFQSFNRSLLNQKVLKTKILKKTFNEKLIET